MHLTLNRQNLTLNRQNKQTVRKEGEIPPGKKSPAGNVYKVDHKVDDTEHIQAPTDTYVNCTFYVVSGTNITLNIGGEKVTTTMDDILTKKCSDVGKKILTKSTNVRNNTNFATLYENSGENTTSSSTTAPAPTVDSKKVCEDKCFVLVTNKRKNISSSDDNGLANKGREKLSMNVSTSPTDEMSVSTSPTDEKEENTRNAEKTIPFVWNPYQKSYVERGKIEENPENCCFDYETSFLRQRDGNITERKTSC